MLDHVYRDPDKMLEYYTRLFVPASGGFAGLSVAFLIALMSVPTLPHNAQLQNALIIFAGVLPLFILIFALSSLDVRSRWIMMAFAVGVCVDIFAIGDLLNALSMLASNVFNATSAVCAMMFYLAVHLSLRRVKNERERAASLGGLQPMNVHTSLQSHQRKPHHKSTQ